MLRPHEKESSWKAGALAIAVHLFLLGALLFSFNWKAAHPVQNVAEVELWDSLPNKSSPPLPPVSKPKIEPPPEIKKEPKSEAIVEQKVEEPAVDIALEKKKELEKKKAEEKIAKLETEKLKKEQELEKKKQLDALKASIDDTAPDNSKQLKEKKARDDALKAMQNDIGNEGEKQANAGKAAASKGVIDEYRRKIQDKIKGNVNNSLCGDGSPVIKFQINLMPTGELSGHPKRTKSSDIEACDEAVERAIMASQPLPMPDDASLRSQFRDLNLTFEPNK
ncbi:MAG: cell envelope integrity protein TolA [Methylophilaceae bacterium]